MWPCRILPLLVGAGMLAYETGWGEGRWPIVIAGVALLTSTGALLVDAVTGSGGRHSRRST